MNDILYLCMFVLCFVSAQDINRPVSWDKTLENIRSKRNGKLSEVIKDLGNYDSAIHRISRREVSTNNILQDPRCATLKTLCRDPSEMDDMLVIECLQSLHPEAMEKLDGHCQHTIWVQIKNIIQNDNIHDILPESCRKDLENSDCHVDDPKPGSYLKCLVSRKDTFDSKDCIRVIDRFESVAFNDFQFLENFLVHCDKDISTLGCGRMDNSHTNSKTIVCLQNNYMNVSDNCKVEIFRLSEVQADNIKLDQELYKACTDDYMRYCNDFTPGSGHVFKCLLSHRNDKLKAKCREHLFRREKLIAEDFRISKGLMKACREDIKKTRCKKQTSEDKNIRLAQVLLCLENMMKNGTKVEEDCEAEMIDHRRILMEDYRLSPEIVSGCAQEIKKFCKEFDVGGKTIHCLLAVAKPIGGQRRVTDVCQRQLEALIEETDAGEDWRVDPVLRDACYPVVQVACKDVKGGDARVMSCLMDNINADHMTADCEEALIQIQYFVARDFKLDPQLYRACKDDAVRICHAPKSWEEGTGPNNGPLILPCLYRTAYNSERENEINTRCLDQIKRVMRQRAISVDLQPEIEEVCLSDLALYCFQKTKKGEEILCLQDNLEKLEDDKCRETIKQFTEIQAEHTELNPYIMAHCKEIIRMFCPIQKKNDDGDVMDCLIQHKNDPIVKANSKCRISIEHFQIISLKDYRFTYKFKLACKSYAMRFCQNAKTKASVVTCLSEKVTNDTIAGHKSDIQKECRQQIKAQLFQQRENIDFDPILAKACGSDIKTHCKDVEHGSAQVLECLQAVTTKLSSSCEAELFKVKKQEIMDNSVDYALMNICADSIRQFCPNTEPSHVLECLRKNKDEKLFSKKCRVIVIHRIIEQNSDFRLNPSLQENCKLDIKKFCFNIVSNAKPNKEMNGEVIKCLKQSFKHSRLTNTCEKEMSRILKEQALDLQLNPLLRAVCSNELETICKSDENDHGNAEECLKEALIKKQIPTRACQEEVAGLLEESQADIQVDPVLQQACSVDILKYCNDIPQGNGRHLKCLKIIMEDSDKSLTSECKNMLSKRLEMYRNAAELVPPADFQELYSQVVTSPAKHFFFILMLTVVGFIFLLGTFCGRISKRHMVIKNK